MESSELQRELEMKLKLQQPPDSGLSFELENFLSYFLYTVAVGYFV